MLAAVGGGGFCRRRQWILGSGIIACWLFLCGDRFYADGGDTPLLEEANFAGGGGMVYAVGGSLVLALLDCGGFIFSLKAKTARRSRIGLRRAKAESHWRSRRDFPLLVAVYCWPFLDCGGVIFSLPRQKPQGAAAAARGMPRQIWH